MAVIKAFAGALGGTFADLWRDIITAGPFTEHTVVVPGIPRGSNNDRGSNEYGSEGIITNGSRIYVPENTAAFIFSETGIENVITESGGYEYRNGEQSVLAGDGIGSFFNQVADRFTSEVSLAAPNMWPSSTCVRFVASNSALLRRWCITTGSMASIWKFAHADPCR